MSREGLLVHTLVELADNLVDDFDVIDVLTVLSDRCVEALDVDSAGVMLASPTGDLQVVASSSDTMRGLELFELQTDEGPCVDCFRSGEPIVNVELAGCRRPVAHCSPRGRSPTGSTRSTPCPCTSGARRSGRSTCSGSPRAPSGTTTCSSPRRLADVATIAIIQHQAAVDAAALNVQLNEALNSRIIIEQAKGKISEASGRDVDESFRRLRNHARNHNLRLTDLAREVVDGTVAVVRLDPLPRTPAAARPVAPRPGAVLLTVVAPGVHPRTVVTVSSWVPPGTSGTDGCRVRPLWSSRPACRNGDRAARSDRTRRRCRDSCPGHRRRRRSPAASNRRGPPPRTGR